jgi:tetratricopeptide (TPR) repeat protein
MLIMQQWQDAIKLYEELISLYNPEEEFYNNAAIACIKTGNYEEALNKLSKTLQLNPSNIDALFNRSKLYKNLGNTQKANEDLENMKKILRAKKSLTEEEKQLLKI